MKFLIFLILFTITISAQNQSCTDKCQENTRLELLNDIEGAHSQFIKQVQYFPQGDRVVTASGDGHLKVFSTKNQKNLLDIEHPQFVLSVAISKDGKKIATGGWDKTIRVFNSANGHKLHEFSEVHEDWISQLVFSNDGYTLASASADKDVKLWDLKNGEFVTSLVGHDSYVFGLDFSSDDKYIVTGGADKQILIWDVYQPRQKKLIKVIKDAAEDTITSVKFFGSQDMYIVYSSWDMNIRITNWQQKPSQKSQENQKLVDSYKNGVILGFRAHEYSISNVDISQNGKYLISCSEDKSIKIFDFKKIREVLNIRQNSEKVAEAKKIYIEKDFKIVEALDSHESYVWNVKFNPNNSKQFISGGEDAVLKFWEIKEDDDCHKQCLKMEEL